MRRTLAWLVILALALFGVAPPLGAAPAVPEGFRQAALEELAPGVEHLRLERTNDAEVVHVARIAPGAPAALRTVLSNDAVAGSPRLERTSSMCIRLRCLAGINGDFYFLDSGEPVGAAIAAGELLRSPSGSHHQLVVGPDGRLSDGRLEWSGTLVATDLRSLSLDGVNVARQADQLILFTPAFGPSTATNEFGAELTIEVIDPPPPLRLGQTALVRLLGIRTGAGDAPIPAGGAVLSGHGTAASALADLWSRAESGGAAAQALLRLETRPPAIESLGGTPILVRDGRRWFADDDSSLVADRHPRTIVGWNPKGEVLLVTVDGRQPGRSEGMTLAEAAELMIGLGATEAINLDGGGSTTFVVGGAVANDPSDRAVRRGGKERIVNVPQRGDSVIGSVERPVASALVVVPEGPVARPTSNPLEDAGLQLPRALSLASPTAGDPASNPLAALPALVQERRLADPTLALVALAANLAAVGAIALARVRPPPAAGGGPAGGGPPPPPRPRALRQARPGAATGPPGPRTGRPPRVAAASGARRRSWSGSGRGSH